MFASWEDQAPSAAGKKVIAALLERTIGWYENHEKKSKMGRGSFQDYTSDGNKAKPTFLAAKMQRRWYKGLYGDGKY